MGGQRVCVRRVGREKEKNKTAARPLGVVFWLLAEEEMRQSYVVFVVLKVRLQRAHARLGLVIAVHVPVPEGQGYARLSDKHALVAGAFQSDLSTGTSSLQL